MSSLRWVVIETGSNQSLVFRTNKQRLNVAASHLIWKVGFEWIPDAIRQVTSDTAETIRHVVQASGLGVLLASPESGRRVIEAVTTRAVVEAPDLEVWGLVGPTELIGPGNEMIDDGMGEALGEAQRELARWRPHRRAALARDANLPFTQPCSMTGLPATAVVHEGTGPDRTDHAVSAGIAVQWGGAVRARQHLVARLENFSPNADGVIDRAVANVNKLSADGIENNGWVAVLHSDGNGIGDIFTNLRRAYDNSTLPDKLTELSAILERCAWQAVGSAVVETDAGEGDWILPVLVGGDDITAVVHGAYAYRFARTLTDAFETLVNGESAVTDALADIRAWQREVGLEVTAPTRISLATGIAYTKPHHPFSHGVALAEQLTASAKSVKRDEVSALDLHVLHESSLRDLGELRAPLRKQQGTADPIDLWAGPIVLSSSPPDALAPRGVAGLDAAVELVHPPRRGEQPEEAATRVPSGVTHVLRESLTAVGPHNRGQIALVKQRVSAAAIGRSYEASLEQLLAQHLSVGGDGARFSRVLTAMELIDVAHGTAMNRG